MTSHDIRAEYRKRLPKHPPPFNRGGPVQRNPEDVVVEMILEERAAAHARITELEAAIVALGGEVPEAPEVGFGGR